MYHFIVEQRIRTLFDHLNRGDFDYVLGQFAPAAEHWFSGEHALSGVRRSAELRTRWYERLAAVFPGIRFDVKRIVVSGWPWHTHVAVEWTDRIFDVHGVELTPNQGVFMLTLRWGRATELHVYCDTQGLVRNLDVIAAQGTQQAAFAPISEAAST